MEELLLKQKVELENLLKLVEKIEHQDHQENRRDKWQLLEDKLLEYLGR